MRVGLGLYRDMLTAENFRFARQAGATDIVAHLVDYHAYGVSPERLGRSAFPGRAGLPVWSVTELTELRRAIESEGLRLAAVENVDPAYWSDILLGGPHADAQLETMQLLVRNLGAAGIPTLGYLFSIVGVWGQASEPWARGNAVSLGFRGPTPVPETPAPANEIWGMRVSDAPGTVADLTEEQLWVRLAGFLDAVVPVAEEAGVRLAAHPDDPPCSRLRDVPRLLYTPANLQRLVDLHPSPANTLEFCQGTVAEMDSDTDVYSVIADFSRQRRIGYVHFRNVVGTVPNYREVFIDEGDVDMQRALAGYAANGYDGLFVPDHTPAMSCGAPWHAGMAFALGYLTASIRALG